MKLMDSNEVCDLLGISKSTLFRWCGVSENSEDILPQLPRIAQHMASISRQRRSTLNFSSAGSDETPNDFPRPFKIGRAYKWKDTEIMDWLETKRV